jgi:integrase/recombinase XerD
MNIEELLGLLNNYLANRRAMGLKDGPHRRLLNDFIHHISIEGIFAPLLTQRALGWACSTPNSNAITNQVVRIQVVRGFLSYLKTIFPQIEIPPAGMLRGQRRSQPYLFSHDEIVRLIDLAGTLGPRGSLRPYTYQTIIGLLASTGLRTSEALRLTIADVKLDLSPPRLHIFKTKFQKSRWVPLHPTTAEALRHYQERRCHGKYVEPIDPFFISSRGKPIPHYVIKQGFASLVNRLGAVGTGYQRGPSLHSLRHSFAVHRLNTWYQQGADVRALAPKLSVYLGHGHLSDTYWYLSASPELLNAASDLFYLYAEKEEAR